jgi:hypothetical protein
VATVITALRGAPELAATTSVTDPLPVPVEAPETVIQLGKPETAHVQLAVVWIPIGKEPPAAAGCSEVVLSV